MITDDQITALAREYAEELSPDNKVEREMIELDCLGFLDRVLNSYCLVERSKFEELEIARRAKEHGAVWLNQWEAESLFPEIAKEVEG